MKKSLQLLVTGAMFAAGAMTASADRYYQRGDEPVDAYSIEAGVEYVLNCARPENAGEKAFLNGTTFLFGTENITKSCLYTFVAAGKNSKGEPVYYIKNSEGHYFTAPGRAVGYTDNLDNAWKVTIKPVNAEYESDYEYSTDDEDFTGMAAYRQEYRESGDGLDLSDASFFADSEYGVVIANAEPDDPSDICSTYTYLVGVGNGATSGNVTRGTNYNNNVWVVYTVELQSASAYLESVLAELFPDGWEPENINVGIDPGCYSQDAVDAVTEAYENAMYNATEENAEELADALKKAYEDFKNSFVNFGPGYYIFTTYRTPRGAMFDNTGNIAGAKANCYTYTDPAIAITHTQNGTEYSIGGGIGKGFDTYAPEDEDPDNEWMKTAVAPYIIWKVIESDEPGLFYVQNYQTGNYIGGAPKDANGNLKPSNAPILVTPTAEAKYNMAPSAQYAGFWKFYSPDLTKTSAWGGGWEMGGLHAPGDVLNMVTWNSETDGSLWYPRAVTDEMLKLIDDYKRQPMLNMQLENLKNEAEQFVESTKVYSIFDLKTGKPAEGLNVFEDEIAVDGLVTDASQLDSNSVHEGDGQGLEGLLDGDTETFYHSGWSDDYAPKSVVEVEDPETGEITEEEVYDKHYLQMDLGHACSQITVKWITRGNGNVQGRLYKTTVYGSKDGVNFEPVTTGEFHYVPFNADNKVTVAGEVKNCWIGVCSYDLGAAYQYVRVEHTENVHGQARPWMNGAELRVYEGLLYEYKYDVENSPFESVPVEVRDELAKQLEAAAEELEDEMATEGTIAALESAYNAFKEATPNPQALRDLITEAAGIHDSAEAGDQPGYFTQDAIDALQKAIDEAEGKYKGSMTVVEVADAKAALQAALDAFQAALIKPENGIYFIKSKSSSDANFGCYVYTQNNSKTIKVAKGYAGKDDVAERTLGAYWQVEKIEGGFAFKNLYTGLYLAPVGKNTDVVAQSEAPYVYTLQFAQEPGCFNAVINAEDAFNGTYLYLNMQPGGGMVTWNSAKGRDNSAFEFVPVDADDLDKVISDGYNYTLEIAAAPQIAVFPVDLYVESVEDVKFYTVLGQDADDNIQLVEADAVVAGQAYVLIPAEGVEGTAVTLFTEAESLDELKPVNELQAPANGLVPVFEPTVVPNKCGIFDAKHTLVKYSEGTDDDKVQANSGYFNEMPGTAEKGAAFIPSRGKFANGIQNIIMNSDVEKGIYSISGVRVNGVKNLPAGLYIINGKKYIVK